MEHTVVLIAPNGREQEARVRISSHGLVLSSSELQELNTFPLQVIRKWMPSSQRVRSPGPPDVLDIQIATDEGPRDLRMRCVDVAAVTSIMSEFQVAVQAAGLPLPASASSFNDVSLMSASMLNAPEDLSPQATSSVSDAELHPVLSQMATDRFAAPEPLSVTAALEQPPQPNPIMQQPAAPATASGLSPADQPRALTPVQTSPTHAAALNQLASTSPATPVPITTQQTSNRSLTTMQLAGALPGQQQLSPGGMVGGMTYEMMSAMVAASPVQGMLAQMGQRNRQLQHHNGQLRTELQELQDSAALQRSTLRSKLITTESEVLQLRAEAENAAIERQEQEALLVVRSTVQLALARVIAGSATSEALTDLGAVSVELAVCRDALAASELRGAGLDVEARELRSALIKSEESVLNLHCELGAHKQDHKDAVEALDLQVCDLTQQLEAVKALLDSERAAAGTAASEARGAYNALDQENSRLCRELEHMRHQAAVQQAELATAQARILSALEGQAVLQVELGSAREQLDAAEAQSARDKAEIASQTAIISGLKAQVAELQGIESTLQAHLRQVTEEAEAARTEVGSISVGQRELQREAEVLRERLESVRQVSRDQALWEMQLRVDEAAEQLKQAQEEIEASRKQCDAHKEASERLQQETTKLKFEMAAVRMELEESRSNQCGMSVMSLSAMERVQALERSCGEAGKKLEATQQLLRERDVRLQAGEHRVAELERRHAAAAAMWQAERTRMEAQWEVERQGWLARCTMQLDGWQAKAHVEHQGAEALWHVERQALEAKVRDLARALSKVEEHASTKVDGMVSLVEQVESLEGQLKAARAATAKAEEEVRLQAVKHRREVSTLQSKVDGTGDGHARQLAEVEARVEAKEKLLARWREEAQSIAVKLEGALVEHRRELDEQRREAAVLREQCQALNRDNAMLRSELGDVQAAASYLRSLVNEGDVKLEQLGGHLSEVQGREKELEYEVQALHGLLDKARVAFAKKAPGGSPIPPLAGRASGAYNLHAFGDAGEGSSFDGSARKARLTPRQGAVRKTAAITVLAGTE